MINIRIPNEIRSYKEKVVAGLTARQLIASIVAALICVPLYFWGKNFLPEDIVSWVVLIIAIPLMAVGFIKISGMPMEKFSVAVVRWFIAPSKRKYATDNYFRENDEKYRLEVKRQLGSKNIKKINTFKKRSAMERIVLMQEANERGDLQMFDPEKAEILTEKKPDIPMPEISSFEYNADKVKSDDTLKMSKSMRHKIMQGEAIQRKIDANPEYVMTKPEFKTMKAYHAAIESNRKKQLERKKKEAAKINSTMKKRRTAKYTIPKITADSIPIVATYDGGVIEVAPNKYSKQYAIQDINYHTARPEVQLAAFQKLCELYNYFPDNVHFSFHIDNCIVSAEEQEKQVLYKQTGDDLDAHRAEYNRVLKQQLAIGRNDIQLKKFLTVTIDADEPLEALMQFMRLDVEIQSRFSKIGDDGDTGNGARAIPMTTTDRLAYYHDKMRYGHEGEFSIDYDFLKKQGLSCRDYIAPASFDFGHAKYFKMGDKFYRCLYLSKLPKALNDEFLHDLYSVDFPMTFAMNVQPVDQAKGMKIVQRQLTGIEGDKMNAEKRAARSGYSTENIRHDIKDAHEQALQLYDDMQNKDQKMFFVSFTILVEGDTLEQLNSNVAVIEGKAASQTCQLMSLPYQQEEAFKMTLPFGYVSPQMAIDRTLTTESSAIFVPFSVQNLWQKGGIPYGINPLSKNINLIDRWGMKTPSGFVLGTTGSGKSMATKREILNVLLRDPDTNIIVIDPENEYGWFCRAFGGTVINISSESDSYINPMDMEQDYGLDEDDDPDNTPLNVKKEKAIKKKSDFIMSIIERMISSGGNSDYSSITSVQKTIVDRCVKKCYNNYLEHDFDPQYLPTLIDLQAEFDAEKEREQNELKSYGAASEIAESVEYYTKGSMNLFSHKTNVDLSNRLIVFNIKSLGIQLRQIALTIVFDFIWNRMVRNSNNKVKTYCYADEIHVMFASFYSAEFMKQLYKRGRKYGLCVTGITQNVSDLLASAQARNMLGNSDFIMMLNQKSEDYAILSEMLKISDSQRKFIQNSDPGDGLLYAEKVLVPFEDNFPSDSYLYKLMTTKFGESMSPEEAEELIRSIMPKSA